MHVHQCARVATWSGFHLLPAQKRLQRVQRHAGLDDADVAALIAPSALADDQAEAFIENAVGSFPIPLGFAVGFVIDGRDTVVPMAVEESSVVAAASHGAKMVAAGGGFATDVADPVTIGQVELRRVTDPVGSAQGLAPRKAAWMAALDEKIPTMVARGGGVRDILARPFPDGRLVLHLHVDTREAMGANVVNSLCEAFAAVAAKAFGGTVGLRILSNLATQRLATARFEVPVAAVGGMDAAQAIVAANQFALIDPYRAVTHNKGIMNGIDPVAIATGNDWRAIEAGAHGYAAMDGRYRGLTEYATQGDRLQGTLTLPLSVGTIGGVTTLHPTARACLKVLGTPDARRLAGIMASVGLAQNLSALRALATQGIQRGHMALHARNLALQAGLNGKEAERVARQMVADGDVSLERARRLAGADA